jgi:ubiquinone/menaquinone biosynthesis C-methylase UbiE
MIEIQKLLGALRAAAEPTRLRLLALCAHADLTVNELAQVLGQSQPRISRHLKLLCEADLLNRSREGVWAFYRLTPGRGDGSLGDFAQSLVDSIAEDDPEMVRDMARLDALQHERASAAEVYFRSNAAHWDTLRCLYVDEAKIEKHLLHLVPGPVHDHLDLGTGTGRILELFADRAERGLGIDLSHEMLSVARANLARSPQSRRLSVRHGDICNLPLRDDSFDLVTLHQVLHYASDPASVIHEAGRVLEPGGQVLVVDFAPHELEFLRAEHAHRRLGFSDDEVKAWLEAAGLSPSEPQHLAGNPLTVTIWPATAA